MAASTTKKMSLMQLTILVSVNMMGSGIIMLPTNMAQVGAISLLSWIVTAVGSMLIAYGFAQAGIFNNRPGGMSAYAEDAYGKPGYFMVFLLYFFSLAIGNVAIAISAVGYLSGFFPGLSATPIATCLSVIGLIWLTSVANFGGPSITGRIGSVTVWGVIIPVAGLSIIGWFWFKSDTFMQAWNPQGMSIGEGMGSSIALTLWAFLGMESAAQNSDAVEDPKRNVPLACMFGTLGAAVIYILSTTVIQGIVPNAELAESTGPFALAYAHMFNPTVGSIIMALAILACLGSLLGWQFTISQTAKAAADDRMFPRFFSKLNKLGAPVMGLIIMGVVQSVMALSTISPSLSEQFSALVNLAVVTNVVPYIIALSALVVMMKKAGVTSGVYKRNVIIGVGAMLYSTYAIYASGKDAVLGGMIIVALTYILWGFLAPRFASVKPAAAPASAGGVAASGIALAALLALVLLLAGTQPAEAAGTMDRIKSSGKLKLGYSADTRPFTFDGGSGPAGFAIDLCMAIAGEAKAAPGMGALAVEFVPLAHDEGPQAVAQGKVDISCEPTVPTRTSRKQVSYSIPVFASGVGVVVSKDASSRLKNILSGQTPPTSPTWRANADKLIRESTFSVIEGTQSQRVFEQRMSQLKLIPKVSTVKDFDAGIQDVIDGRANAFFGNRAILLDAVKRKGGSAHLEVLDRLFTNETYAFAVPRGDEDFRLLVDGALSRLFLSNELGDVYGKWFGLLNENARSLFQLNALPD
ncbi:MAG TPA: putrescine-ornithine antiporter [Burkholderiales bacterium]